MNRFFEQVTFLFDPLHHIWEREKMHRHLAGIILATFVCGLLAIECKRLGLLPETLAGQMPNSHFYAINLAFGMVLVLEVIGLIFTLPCSFSQSVGKQFQILALIMLRHCFSELAAFPEPIRIGTDLTAVWHILAYGFGALTIFSLLGVYYRIQPKQKQDSQPADLYGFVAAKKFISLLLLATFIVMGLSDLYATLTFQPHEDFFPTFYTILIFADVLLVLISQYFYPEFHSVFRNSGYAISTLFIRLALAAPPLYDIGLGVFSVIFAIAQALSWTYIFRQPE